MAEQPDSNWGRHLSSGLQIVVGVLLGFFVGRWLDRKFNTAPWCLMTGSMLGLAAGMYLLIKDAIRMNKP